MSWSSAGKLTVVVALKNGVFWNVAVQSSEPVCVQVGSVMTEIVELAVSVTSLPQTVHIAVAVQVE